MYTNAERSAMQQNQELAARKARREAYAAGVAAGTIQVDPAAYPFIITEGDGQPRPDSNPSFVAPIYNPAVLPTAEDREKFGFTSPYASALANPDTIPLMHGETQEQGVARIQRQNDELLARQARREAMRGNTTFGGGTGGGGAVPGPSGGGGGTVPGPGGPGPGPGPGTGPGTAGGGAGGGGTVPQSQTPFTGPGGTIYPNSIQTPYGPQPTYFPTHWWTSSPTASNAYGRTTGSTARNFDSEMADYRANYAPVFTRPAPPPAISGPSLGQDPSKPPIASPGFGNQWVWEGDRWVAKPNAGTTTTGIDTGFDYGGDSPGDAGVSGVGVGDGGGGMSNSGEGGGGPGTGGWARGGEVNKLWNKYHGR
jgi:hypothetical protein